MERMNPNETINSTETKRSNGTEWNDGFIKSTEWKRLNSNQNINRINQLNPMIIGPFETIGSPRIETINTQNRLKLNFTQSKRIYPLNQN